MDLVLNHCHTVSVVLSVTKLLDLKLGYLYYMQSCSCVFQASWVIVSTCQATILYSTTLSLPSFFCFCFLRSCILEVCSLTSYLFNQNKLKPNLAKNEITLTTLLYTSDGVQLTFTYSVMSVGVVLDQALLLEKQVIAKL